MLCMWMDNGQCILHDLIGDAMMAKTFCIFCTTWTLFNEYWTKYYLYMQCYQVIRTEVSNKLVSTDCSGWWEFLKNG